MYIPREYRDKNKKPVVTKEIIDISKTLYKEYEKWITAEYPGTTLTFIYPIPVWWYGINAWGFSALITQKCSGREKTEMNIIIPPTYPHTKPYISG